MMMMIERRFGVVLVAGGEEWREEGVSEERANNKKGEQTTKRIKEKHKERVRLNTRGRFQFLPFSFSIRFRLHYSVPIFGCLSF